MDNREFTDVVAAYEGSMPVATIQIDDKTLRYFAPNETCLSRVVTLTTKEPHTIVWLNSMPVGAVLLDIGANVGMYSIYAGVMRGARIYAFEPEAQNYALLCRNLQLNSLAERSVAWCAALSDETKFDRIYLSDNSAGGSCNSFADQVDPYLRQRSFKFVQGSQATTVDALVHANAMAVPSFIKIDVDGLEHKIIKGAAETLRNPAVLSLLIEINSHVPEHMQIVDFLASLGFNHDPTQFVDAQRKSGYFQGVGEYVFRR